MAVIRVNKTDDYTVMSNEHFKNKAMSLQAKGLLSLMLSLPDAWDFSIRGLCSLCKECKSTIERLLNELKELGYVKITKLMPNETKSGRIEYIYDIFEVSQKTRPQKQDLENKALNDKTRPQKQGLVNGTQLNTKELITNNLEKENITKEKDIANEICTYLSNKTGKRWSASRKETVGHIKARLKEGHTLADFKTVIDKKVLEWQDDEKMKKYLRPDTLFSSKFEWYLNQDGKVQPRAPAKEGRNYTEEDFETLIIDPTREN